MVPVLEMHSSAGEVTSGTAQGALQYWMWTPDFLPMMFAHQFTDSSPGSGLVSVLFFILGPYLAVPKVDLWLCTQSCSPRGAPDQTQVSCVQDKHLPCWMIALDNGLGSLRELQMCDHNPASPANSSQKGTKRKARETWPPPTDGPACSLCCAVLC